MTALGRISREWLNPASQIFLFCSVFGEFNLKNLPDKSSLAASSRLQNASEFCIKVRKTGPTGNESYLIIWPLFDLISNLHEH